MSLEPRADYRCSTAGRWLPRILGGSLLAAFVVTALRTDPEGVVAGSTTFKGLVALFGGVLSLWIVRKGAEVGRVVALGPEAIEFSHGRRSASLAYRDIETLDYVPALGPTRHWIPAAVLVDRAGGRWRLPALIDRGDRLILELLERCGRSDLEAWADVRQLERRMGRASRILALGYGGAGSVLGLATALYFGP